MAKYNGHKNWNHWNVSLWINNDEGLYSLAKDMCKGNTKDDAAVLILDALERCGLTHTPNGVRYNKTNIRAALVDF